MASIQGFDLDSFIRNALIEDVGDGDHTSLACLDTKTKGEARLIIKQAGILSGVEVAKRIFQIVDKALKVKIFLHDGTPVTPSDVVLIVSGSAQSILAAERLVLNCMQRMSGIATKTNLIVKKLKGYKTKVLDTRKTTPGFRALEKIAIKTGGAVNHRFGLYDMILIKDNHVDYSGGIENAIRSATLYNKKGKRKLKIEIETRNIEEVAEALKTGGVDRIMLDNFSIPKIKKAVKLIAGKFETEASGKITSENILSYAKAGVDFISMGSLTHSYQSLDMSLKAVIKK